MGAAIAGSKGGGAAEERGKQSYHYEEGILVGNFRKLRRVLRVKIPPIYLYNFAFFFKKKYQIEAAPNSSSSPTLAVSASTV